MAERALTQGLASALGGLIAGQLESIEEEHQKVVRRLVDAERALADRAASVPRSVSREAVEAAARALHDHQEYTTCWDDGQAGQTSRMGTPMRPLGEHGRNFYLALAEIALLAGSEDGAR